MQINEPSVAYRDVLGFEQSVAGTEIQETLQGAAKSLAQEIAQRVTDINGAPPSAMFLAGGGSKLLGLKELVAEALGMDQRRVALAGNNYDISAFSREYEINDPEYATPLGIAVSAGLGLISDSYRIMLNGKPAKLFRSGSLTVLDLLMMNGYTSADLVGRTGRSLSVTVDGQRLTFRGESAAPCVLRRNGEDARPSALVYAGDSIEFTPAVPGASAQRTPGDLLGADYAGGVLINGRPASLDTPLRSGDQVVSTVSAPPPTEAVPEPEPVAPWQGPEEPSGASARRPLFLYLNGEPLVLPGKADGGPYFLMDLLDRSGIDFETLDVPLVLQVNGADCPFTQVLRNNDQVTIRRGQ